MVSPVSNYAMELPARDAVEFGMPYQVKGSSVGVDFLGNPAVNESNLSVRMRISTDAVDRERMVVRQEGIDVSLYRLNPVVLFGHGEDGIVLPVATSEDEQGNCTVTLEEDGTYAVAYHKAKNKTSMQMFDAVNCGLLRASSVGITPKEVSVQYDKRKQKVPVIDECYLNEWSYCSVGVNPEAFVKSHRKTPMQSRIAEAYALQCAAASTILQKNMLDGSPILPQIRRSLSRLVPKASAYTNGQNFGDHQMKKSLTRVQVKRMTALQLAKSMTKMLDYDMETQKMFGDEVDEREMSDDVEDVADTETEYTEDTEGVASDPIDKMADTESPMVEASTGGQKPGSAAIHKVHADLKALVSHAEAAIAPIENPSVVKEIGKEVEQLRDIMLRIESIHTKLYADQPSLATEEPEISEDMVKSWLVTDSRRPVQLAAIAGRFASWARRLQTGEVEPKQLVKSLSRSAQDLNRIVSAAKDVTADDQVEARIAAFESTVQKLMEKLDSTPA